jgi:hypothetical protein
MNRLRAAILVVALLLPALAAANASMGLALEMFDYTPWLIYVAVTVVFEAWMIGGWLRLHWLACIGVSIFANSFTALCCPMVATPMLHEAYIGGKLNPSPFLTVVVWLVVLGLFSAVFESAFWYWARLASKKARSEHPLRRSILAHMVGVPLALIILLAPAHPYRALSITMGERRPILWEALLGTLRISENGDGVTVPSVKSVPALLRLAETTSNPKARDVTWPAETWTAAYVMDYGRFDLGETKRHPVEWNVAAAGKTFKLSDSMKEVVGPWLVRYRFEDGRVGGLCLNLGGSEFDWQRLKYSDDPVALGYSAPKPGR